MKSVVKSFVVALGIALVGVSGGCKQGLGERCQVIADCEDGLICNQATMTCQSTTGGQIDATVPDGPPIVVDAFVVDAVPDAVPDAPPLAQ